MATKKQHFKASICHFWAEKGKCSHGDKCQYARTSPTPPLTKNKQQQNKKLCFFPTRLSGDLDLGRALGVSPQPTENSLDARSRVAFHSLSRVPAPSRRGPRDTRSRMCRAPRRPSIAFPSRQRAKNDKVPTLFCCLTHTPPFSPTPFQQQTARTT